MDIISHGLWGGAVFGRKNKKSFWLAFFCGIAPDLFSFGIFFITNILGITQRPDWRHEPPLNSSIPEYIHTLYSITHSLVIFAAVFFLLWLIFRRPIWELGAWGIHIGLDIVTHSFQFFPTPFLWPLSSYKFDGIGWGRPEIFFPDIILLVIIYGGYFYFHMRKKKN